MTDRGDVQVAEELPPDGYCGDTGTGHARIITFAEDGYNPDGLGLVANSEMFGHCPRCNGVFRWSAADQRWRMWPGRLASLPALTDEELEELHTAVAGRLNDLLNVLSLAEAGLLRAEVDHRMILLRSLDTAIAEARLATRSGEPSAARLGGR